MWKLFKRSLTQITTTTAFLLWYLAMQTVLVLLAQGYYRAKGKALLKTLKIVPFSTVEFPLGMKLQLSSCQNRDEGR